MFLFYKANEFVIDLLFIQIMFLKTSKKTG